MTDVIQSAPTSSLSSASSQSTPLVTAAKNPLSMPIVSSRFAGVIPQNSAPAAPKAATPSLPFTPGHPLSMIRGTSSFAAVIPKPSAPATPKTTTPKPSWNRELDLSGNTKISPPEKKGRGRHNKRRTLMGQAPAKNLGPCNAPTSTSLSPAPVLTAPVATSVSPTKVALRPTAPEFVPRAAAASVVTPSPPTSAPSSPTTSADSSEDPTSNYRENSKVKKEHIVYLQRLSKEGLEKDEIAKRTAAEFPDLCKGMRNGCKVATEETRLEAVGDAVFMHTMRYAHR